MVNRNRIKIGIEIECCYNRDFVDFSLSGYHSGNFNKKTWKIEGDGSLRNSNIFEDEGTAEFISKVLGGKKTYIKALKEFQNLFNGEKLENVLDFNTSCGNHIHIGLNNKRKYHNKLSFDTFKELRERYFKEIKNSNVLSEDTKQKILNHYFRGYAQKIKKASWESGTGSRGVEFNKQSENSGCGLEWRSVNLYEVNSWAEFFEVFEIVYNCVEWLFKKRTTSHQSKFKTIRLNRLRLREIQNDNDKKIIIEIPNNNNQNINIQIKNSEILQCVI